MGEQKNIQKERLVHSVKYRLNRDDWSLGFALSFLYRSMLKPALRIWTSDPLIGIGSILAAISLLSLIGQWESIDFHSYALEIVTKWNSLSVMLFEFFASWLFLEYPSWLPSGFALYFLIGVAVARSFIIYSPEHFIEIYCSGHKTGKILLLKKSLYNLIWSLPAILFWPGRLFSRLSYDTIQYFNVFRQEPKKGGSWKSPTKGESNFFYTVRELLVQVRKFYDRRQSDNPPPSDVWPTQLWTIFVGQLAMTLFATLVLLIVSIQY